MGKVGPIEVPFNVAGVMGHNSGENLVAKPHRKKCHNSVHFYFLSPHRNFKRVLKIWSHSVTLIFEHSLCDTLPIELPFNFAHEK